MLISDSTARALENVTARERELLRTLPAQPADADPYAAEIACATPPGDYFITRDENAQRLFMRCSSLYVRGAELTDGNGRPVLGYTAPGGALQALQLDAVDASLGLTQNIRVGADGVVSYDRSAVDPSSGKRVMQQLTVGRLALARFPAGTRLHGIDDSYAAPPPGVAPHIGVPGEDGFPPLPAPRETVRNDDLDIGLTRLQEAYLALDALRAAGTAQGSVQKTVMDLLK